MWDSFRLLYIIEESKMFPKDIVSMGAGYWIGMLLMGADTGMGMLLMGAGTGIGWLSFSIT